MVWQWWCGAAHVLQAEGQLVLPVPEQRQGFHWGLVGPLHCCPGGGGKLFCYGQVGGSSCISYHRLHRWLDCLVGVVLPLGCVVLVGQWLLFHSSAQAVPLQGGDIETIWI